MRRLQHEMQSLFGEMVPGGRRLLAGDYPPVNLARDDNGITLEALCPGVDRPTLETTVIGDTVTIRGERKPEPGVPDEAYHRRERMLGPFARTVSVGDRLDPDRAEATYTNGILRIRLARTPEAAPKKIAIKS
jgi:HSP20 family protein